MDNNSTIYNPYQDIPYHDVNAPNLDIANIPRKHSKLAIVVYIGVAILVNLLLLMYINGRHIYKSENTEILSNSTTTK